MRFHLHAAFPLLLIATAAAQPDDRELTIPVSSEWYYDVTPQFIATAAGQGFRLTDIEVSNPSAPTFNVILVRNTGPYRRPAWWWYYGQTEQQMVARLAANQARLIDLDAYTDGGGNLRFCGIMVDNTGAGQKDSWVWFGVSPATIANHLAADNARIIDLDTYFVGRTRVFAAVTIRNAGADARAWWWYYGVSGAQVQQLLQQNIARPIDLERMGSDSFAVVMVRTPRGTDSWYFTGIQQNEVIGRLSQYGARLVDIEQTTSSFPILFDIVLIENTDGFIDFGSGCAGNNGVPVLFGAGRPALGESVAFGLNTGPTNQWGTVYLGGSRSSWNGIPLPFSLALFGVPQCSVLTDLLVPLPLYSNVSGVGRSNNVQIPILPQLLNQSFYAQGLFPDPGANALNIILTNGVEILLRA